LPSDQFSVVGWRCQKCIAQQKKAEPYTDISGVSHSEDTLAKMKWLDGAIHAVASLIDHATTTKEKT
jgi:hypothetical protein